MADNLSVFKRTCSPFEAKENISDGLNGKTQVLNVVFKKIRAEIVNPAGKFAIFFTKQFAIRNFKDSKAVYKVVNSMKTPVQHMDCELNCHKFWTKQIQTKWNRQEETLFYNIRRCSMGITIGDVSIYKRGRKEYNGVKRKRNLRTRLAGG